MFLFTNAPNVSATTKDVSVKDAPLNSVVRGASSNSGVSFDYLIKTAQRESNLNPNAKAKTSTASGLYQFLDQTWLSTVKTEGAKLGLQSEADQIVMNKNGRLSVLDPAMRDKILGLRNDPVVSSRLAAAFTLRNQAQLASNLGREPSDGELYLAHFLGANGAGEFIRQAVQSPDANAASAFPDAANANHSIFYDKSGKAKTIAEVYSALVSHYGVDTQSVSKDHVNTQSVKHEGKPLFGLFHGSDTGPVAQPIQNAWGGMGRNAFGTGGKTLFSAKQSQLPISTVEQQQIPERIASQPPLNLLSFLRKR
jgi:Transglycosylase SLT domain